MNEMNLKSDASTESAPMPVAGPRFRFELAAAYVVGVALPIMETIRRRTNFDEIPFYIDDYLMGGLLLWGAIAVTRRRAYGNALLVAGWAVLCGGMWGSFFGQWYSIDAKDISGFPHWFVILVKAALFLTAIVALVQSIRNCGKRDAPS